jgi:RimJ/RimL family protein N-acetyltransferase
MVDLPAHPTRAVKVLRGSRYDLFPFKEEDISERYLGWLNDPDVNRFLEIRFVHQTRETVLKYVRSFYADTEKYMWGIYPKGCSEPIGTATLANIDRNHGSGGTGLMIGETAYWGKGASLEALKLVAEFAFETLGLHRLSAVSCAPNHGLSFTHKMFGYRLEGTFKRSLFLAPGTYVDQFAWGMLAEEWRARGRRRSVQGGRHDA